MTVKHCLLNSLFDDEFFCFENRVRLRVRHAIEGDFRSAPRKTKLHRRLPLKYSAAMVNSGVGCLAKIIAYPCGKVSFSLFPIYIQKSGNFCLFFPQDHIITPLLPPRISMPQMPTGQHFNMSLSHRYHVDFDLNNECFSLVVL